MKFLLELRKPYLNVSFSPDRHTQARVIERPGLWMTESQQLELIQDLRRVFLSLGIGMVDYGLFKGTKQALDSCVITLIYDRNSMEPIAFNVMTLMPCFLKGKTQMVVHLGLVSVNPNFRAKGFSWVLYGFTTFLLFLKNRFKPIWISNVTQVPAIIGMVSESFVNVFPNPKFSSRRSFDHLALAREIMGKYRFVFGVSEDAEFDEEDFVIRNAYTGGSDNLKKTYEQAPKHRSELYNEFCHQHLDYVRGDDFLQLGQIDLMAYYNYIIRLIPSGSALVTFYRILFGLFRLSLVPLIQWFSTGKQFGVLRPRKTNT